MATINELVKEREILQKEYSMLLSFQNSIEYIPDHATLINQIGSMMTARDVRINDITRILDAKA